MVCGFLQSFVGFCKGSWVNAIVRRFSQRFVVLNGSLVCVFSQWFVGFRNGSWVFAKVRGLTQWFVVFYKVFCFVISLYICIIY